MHDVCMENVNNCTFGDSREIKNRYYMLFTDLGLVYTVKHCDIRTRNATLGLWPLAAFSRPQFFTIKTSRLANNINYFIQCFDM